MQKIFLVDDHPMVTQGLERTISESCVKCSCKSFGSAEELLDAIETNTPQLIISDISLPGMDGIELAKIVKKKLPEVKILFLTMHQQVWRIKEISKQKANGLIFKTSPPSEIIDAVNAVLKGEVYYCNDAKEILLNSAIDTNDITLTQREKIVLDLIYRGYTSQKIAQELFISENTVESYRRSLFQKFDVKNATSLVAKANELGYFE
ncbi:MAG TPA: response regulator transcription factor [Tenuifilaceae bacterium]|nr:response regulator transcription factor [Tenuifilaceae bacterium]HPQ35275.1 response regulator transcription factor [Tenuifilaceae bacterium]